MIASISISMQSLGMGQIVIRNIDTAVIEALRRGAAAAAPRWRSKPAAR